MAIAGTPTVAPPRPPPGLEAAPAVERPRRVRVAYLDNLKVLLVAVIIAAHGVAGYSDLESAWPYQDIQEAQLSALANGLLGMVLLPSVLFVMGLFFLISGVLTPGSLARKGPRSFSRDRLLRLGLPLLLWTLVIWPGSTWIAYMAAGEPDSFLDQLMDDEPVLDTGPMWFVAVLLIYSLAYAAWWAWRGRGQAGAAPAAASPSAPLPGRRLVAIAAAVSLATVLVRLVFPLLSPQLGQSHLWQWPQFVAMFALGVVAAQRGWLQPVPERIRRGCGSITLLGLLAFLLLAGTMVATGVEPDVLFDERWHWAPLALAAIEGPLAVGACVWMLGVAQRHLDRPPGELGRALARSAFAAFICQGVVLIGLMVALRPLDLPAEAKALAVAALGVAASFALGWVLVTRTRLGRVL